MAETPTPQAPGGMALGRFVMAKLQRAGVGFVQWVWRYSPGLARPGGSFPQHRALAGTVHPEMPTSDGWEPGDHKGCVLPGTVVDAASVSALTLRWYEGSVVRLATAAGEHLAVTPNHPILTDEGWVPACGLVEGDHVVRCLDAHRASGLVPDEHHRPALVEDVFASAWRTHQMSARRVPVATEDFHGDGSGGEVHVVPLDGDLRDDRHASVGEPTGHTPLRVVRGLGEPLTGLCRTDEALRRVGSSPLGLVGALGHGDTLSGGEPPHPELALLRRRTATDTGLSEVPVDNRTGYTESVSERQHGFSVSVASDKGVHVQSDASRGRAPDPVPNDSRTPQRPVDGSLLHAEVLGDSLEGLTGLVSLDKVISVDRRPWAGHVFNLETGLGWYVAAATIVHNCRCGVTPRLRSLETGRFVAASVLEGDQP